MSVAVVRDGGAPQPVWLKLAFPRDLSPEGVQGFLGSLTGLLLPWWRRPFVRPPHVLVETIATSKGIFHFLSVDESSASVVENALQAAVPGVRYERVDPPTYKVTAAAEYRLSTSNRALRSDATLTASGQLASLQPLEKGELVVVSWTLAPASPQPVPQVPEGNRPGNWWWPSSGPSTSEGVGSLKQKQAAPLLVGTARIGVRASNVGRARSLLRRTEAAWHLTRRSGVHLRRRLLPEAWVASRVNGRVVPTAEWSGTFNVEELTGLLGWPVGTGQMPGLTFGGCRPLAPAEGIPRAGIVVGDSTYPGIDRPLALSTQALLRHTHVLGPTGSGKSTLLANMIVQALTANYGVIVIDMQGSLLDLVVERVPPGRRSDIIVWDARDDGYAVGLNPLAEADTAGNEVVVENLLGLFSALWRLDTAPRTKDVLLAALQTLLTVPGATLCELPLLLTDPSYRSRIVGQLDDPLGVGPFWAWYDALSEGERLSVIGPVLNKLRQFVMRPRVRAIVGQAQPRLRIDDVLASGKVLLVSLAEGLLGGEAASLLGALVVAEVWNATLRRVALPPEERRPVLAVIDEFQRVLRLPTPMPDVFARARGLGLGLVVAHQDLSQLPKDLQAAVFANCRSRVAYQMSSADARIVSRELGGALTPEDLQGIAAFEAVTQIYADGTTHPPATIKTHPLTPVCADVEEVRRWSRDAYGVERSAIEAEIRQRQFGSQDETPVRRRRKPVDGGEP